MNWSQLSPRDRIALSIGALVIVVTALVFGVIAPYQNSLAALDAKIAARQRQLDALQQQRQELAVLQRQLAAAEARLGQGKAFSLLTFIETVTTQAASKENLIYLRPQPATVKDQLKEETAEAKLEKITLDQLVQLLYAVENTEALLQIKNLRLKKRFDDPARLDVVLTIASYGKNP